MNKARKTLEVAGAVAAVMAPGAPALANTNNSGGSGHFTSSGGAGISAPAHETTHNKLIRSYNAEPAIRKLAREMVTNTNAISNGKADNMRTSHIDLRNNTYADESVTYAMPHGKVDLEEPVAVDIYVAKRDVNENTTAHLPIIDMSFNRTKGGEWSTSIQSSDPTTPNNYYLVSETGQQVVETAQGSVSAGGSSNRTPGSALQIRSTAQATHLLKENIASAEKLVVAINRHGQAPPPGDLMPDA